ncbi:MAG: hypothetical protein ACYCYN_03020, partial [Solirubrobacteraceae bacterium]
MCKLPTPTAHGLSPAATIAVPVPADGLTLYRLLEHAQPSMRDIAADALLRVALTEQRDPGHVDVWGHPADLL